MNSIKKEIENIVSSSKKIGKAYHETGVEVGKAYAKAGKKTAKLFKELYDGEETYEVQIKED